MTQPGQLQHAVQRLKLATRDLQQQWADTRQHWNDAAAERFEEKHLNSLLPTLRMVTAATAEMEELFQSSIRQCHDRDRLEGHAT